MRMHFPSFLWNQWRLALSLGTCPSSGRSHGLAVALLLLLFINSSTAADSQSTQTPHIDAAKATQLSSDDIKALRAFGEKLAHELSSGNTNQVTQLIDINGLWDSVSQNLQASEEVLGRAKLGFFAGMRRSPGSFLRNLLGKDVKFLRVRTRDAEAVALLRVRMGDTEGATYLDVFTTRDNAGKYRVRDFFNQALGERMSTLSSRMLAKGLAAESKSPLEVFLKGNRTSGKDFDRAIAISELVQKGQFREALDQSETLPPAVRKDRFIQFVRVQAATALKDDARQLEVLDEMAAIFPNDPTFAFILIDRHFMKKEFTKALDTVNVLMSDLGRDAFLSALEASCLSELQRPKDALKAVEEGLKVENGDRQLLWTKVSLLAKQKHYAEVSEALDEILNRHQQFADPRKAQEAGLTDYFASPEGIAYLEQLKKLGHLNSNKN